MWENINSENAGITSGKYPERKKPRIDSNHPYTLTRRNEYGEISDDSAKDSMNQNLSGSSVNHPPVNKFRPTTGGKTPYQPLSAELLDPRIQEIAGILEIYTEEKKYMINQMFGQRGNNYEYILKNILPNLFSINPNYYPILKTFLEGINLSKDFFKYFKEPTLPRVFKSIKLNKVKYHNLALYTDIIYTGTPTCKKDDVQVIGWFFGFPDQPQPTGEVYLGGSNIPEKPVNFGENRSFYMIAQGKDDATLKIKPPDLLQSWFLIQPVVRKTAEEVYVDMKLRQNISYGYNNIKMLMKSNKCESKCIFELETFVTQIQKLGDAFCVGCHSPIKFDDLLVYFPEDSAEEEDGDIALIEKSKILKKYIEAPRFRISNRKIAATLPHFEEVVKLNDPKIQPKESNTFISKQTQNEVNQAQKHSGKNHSNRKSKQQQKDRYKLTPSMIMAEYVFSKFKFVGDQIDLDNDLHGGPEPLDDEIFDDPDFKSVDDYMSHIVNS